MTPSEIRDLAGYHVECADNYRRMAEGMGMTPEAVADLIKSHDTWAEKLTHLADNFFTLSTSQ